jgi:hypothetical protein
VYNSAGLCGDLVSVGTVGTSYYFGIGGTALGTACPSPPPSPPPPPPPSTSNIGAVAGGVVGGVVALLLLAVGVWYYRKRRTASHVRAHSHRLPLSPSLPPHHADTFPHPSTSQHEAEPSEIKVVRDPPVVFPSNVAASPPAPAPAVAVAVQPSKVEVEGGGGVYRAAVINYLGASRTHTHTLATSSFPHTHTHTNNICTHVDKSTR